MDNYVLALMLCIGDCVVAFARVCACVDAVYVCL